jgi:hypothetical protein
MNRPPSTLPLAVAIVALTVATTPIQTPAAPAEAQPDPAAARPAGGPRQEAAAPATPKLPDGRCDRCGGCTGVRRVCVVKPVVREQKKVCWDAKSVPHCIPGRSLFCGTCRGQDACGCYTYEVWQPTCARVIIKTEPVKREVTRKVPGFEWTVEERCTACRQRLAGEPGCAAR